MTQFDKRNISMMMDFYEMTMANGYFETGGEKARVAFDVFYRRNPDGGGFSIFAGLAQIIDYVENMHAKYFQRRFSELPARFPVPRRHLRFPRRNNHVPERAVHDGYRGFNRRAAD